MLTPVYNLYSPKCRVEIKDLFCSLIWKSTNFPGLFFFAKWSKRLGPFSGLLMSAGAVSAIKTSPLQENKICFPLFTTCTLWRRYVGRSQTIMESSYFCWQSKHLQLTFVGVGLLFFRFFVGACSKKTFPNKKAKMISRRKRETKDFLTTTASKIKIQRNIFEPCGFQRRTKKKKKNFPTAKQLHAERKKNKTWGKQMKISLFSPDRKQNSILHNEDFSCVEQRRFVQIFDQNSKQKTEIKRTSFLSTQNKAEQVKKG